MVKVRVVAGFVLLCVSCVFAETFYQEMVLVGGYSANRGTVESVGGLQKSSIGFEYFTKMADEYGDSGSADLQVRFAFDSREFVEDPFGVEIHNAWVEYKMALGQNVRFGHFSPSFGLEPVVDTHATLMQTLANWNIGYKHDWGVGYRGSAGDVDVLLSAQTGSGMGFGMKEGSHLLSGRISNPAGQEHAFGFSILSGEILSGNTAYTFPVPEYSSKTTPTSKVGVDYRYTAGQYRFMGEVCIGESGSQDTTGALLELDWRSPSDEALELKAQAQFRGSKPNKNKDDLLMVGVVASYEINKSWTGRFAVFQEVSSPKTEEDTTGAIQLYFFGE